MRKLYNQIMNTEPVRAMSILAAVLIVIINTVAYFLPQLDSAGVLVITGAIGAIASLLTGQTARGFAYAPSTVQEMKTWIEETNPWRHDSGTESLVNYEPGAAATKAQASE